MLFSTCFQTMLQTATSSEHQPLQIAFKERTADTQLALQLIRHCYEEDTLLDG